MRTVLILALLSLGRLVSADTTLVPCTQDPCTSPAPGIGVNCNLAEAIVTGGVRCQTRCDFAPSFYDSSNPDTEPPVIPRPEWAQAFVQCRCEAPLDELVTCASYLAVSLTLGRHPHLAVAESSCECEEAY